MWYIDTNKNYMGDHHMPYIKIALNRSLTLDGRKYGHGVHEVSEATEARVRQMLNARKRSWLQVSKNEPVNDVEDNASARSGVLTAEDLEYGTEGAKAKAAADAADADADAAAKAAADAAAAAELGNDPQPYPCEDPDCDAEFPSEAARDRHVEMNHGPDADLEAANDDLEDATDGDDGDTAADDDEDDNAAEGDDAGEAPEEGEDNAE